MAAQIAIAPGSRVEQWPTVSPAQPNQTPQTTKPPPEVTNTEFLCGIFAGLDGDERPMVVGVRGKIGGKTKWPTGASWAPDIALGVDEDWLNWYFTLSTYKPKDGEYRRQKPQHHRSFGLYLDDVGTKAATRDRLDSCPPSYLIETSAGNFQAGYLFDKPTADHARVEALQEALVKAGLCDPGAKGTSARLGRMPFAVNGKYEPPFECRLVEWHPEIRYSIDEIIDGLDLEPQPEVGRKKVKTATKAATRERQAEADVYRPRAQQNAVVAALIARGLYKSPLGDGRHDITCPWVSEHTDEIDHGTAYFEPSDLFPVGGFKCQHGHAEAHRIGSLLTYLEVKPVDAKHKPSILVAAGELHRVVDAAEQELAAGRRHYQRGGLITIVTTDPGTGETSIKPVSANSLMRALSAIASWEKFDARSDAYVATDPPTKHVNVLFDAESYQHLPVLRGIARQPYLRNNGTLMTGSGFDEATGMFGAFDEREFSVADRPSKREAENALRTLVALLDEFSFAKPVDKAAALSMMLTAAIRPGLKLAPMGHIRAPQIASGKSYLSALIAAFAGPSTPSAYSFPTNEEECSKLLLSALLESPSVVVFDNLTSDLQPFKCLCSALTEEYMTGRVLGVSKVATVPTATLFLSSGNNVDAIRDMARRVVTISLDPKCETPATRRFAADPLQVVRGNRARFVSLALTVVRAFVVAGMPAQKFEPLGGYGEWTRLVRSPLVWLGQPDPASVVFERMSEDPDRELLGRFLVAFATAFGDQPAAVRDIVDQVQTVCGAKSDLAEVVREVAEERGEINRRRLGKWIGRHQGRLVAGKRFARAAQSGGSERWCIEAVLVEGGLVDSRVSSLHGDKTVSTDAEVI